MLTTSHRTVLILLCLLGLGTLLLASALGSENFGPARLWAALLQPASADGELLWRLRLPRAGAAFIVGAMLAVSGALDSRIGRLRLDQRMQSAC